MKLIHALGCAVAVLGLSLPSTGSAAADEVWHGYAPRCQPTELARDAALRDPCEARVAIFGVDGPTMLSRTGSFDVQSTGSINRDERGARSEPRPPL